MSLSPPPNPDDSTLPRLRYCALCRAPFTLFGRLCDRPGERGALAEVEAIEVHHLGPRGHEVCHKLLLSVRACIDFREGTQLRVRTEDQVDTGAGPPDRIRLP